MPDPIYIHISRSTSTSTSWVTLPAPSAVPPLKVPARAAALAVLYVDLFLWCVGTILTVLDLPRLSRPCDAQCELSEAEQELWLGNAYLPWEFGDT
jgi:hypothetical protein